MMSALTISTLHGIASAASLFSIYVRVTTVYTVDVNVSQDLNDDEW